MNEDNSYNLVDEPWIPVLMRDGTNRSVSLGDIFADTDGAIADLALNPYERVAVFRLLLCIAQAALGPDRLKDDPAWKAAKADVGPVASEYLKKWHDRFFLYGPHAFLQPDDAMAVSDDKKTVCDKLVFRLASGNNSTLFDHGAIGGGRILPDAVLALGLLSYQNFSAGGLSGKCLWSGMETAHSLKGAPCREQSMLFTILQGDVLLESIWLNLLSASDIRHGLSSDWGRPAWELESLARKTMQGYGKTVLGHLAPVSRSIKLTNGASSCVLGEAVQYPQLPLWREPMATVKAKDDGSTTYISCDPSRLPWRDLTCILEIRGSGGRKGALALRHLEGLHGDNSFTIWTGGLYSEKAKEIATVEWLASFPASLLEEPSLQRSENAVAWADRQRGALRFASKTYSDLLKIDKASRFSEPAERIYWDILAQPANQSLVQNVGSDTYMDDWKGAAFKAAEEAYRRACPAMNARQMEAFAQGFAKLRVPGEKKAKAAGGKDFEEEGGYNV